MNRILLATILFISTTSIQAFDLGGLIGHQKAGDVQSQTKARTPVELMAEARLEVDGVKYFDATQISSEESVAFHGFTAIYVDGEFKALTNSNMDGDDHLVVFPNLYSNAPRRMYSKHDGRWIKVEGDQFVEVIRTKLLPALDTHYFSKVGGSENAKAIVVLGSQCGHSQYMEEYLVVHRVPHLIMPVLFRDTTNSLVALACAQPATWWNWSVGKQVTFSECGEKVGYDKFSEQAEPVLMSLKGFNERGGYPFTIFPNGATYSGWDDADKDSNMKFLNMLKASQGQSGTQLEWAKSSEVH